MILDIELQCSSTKPSLVNCVCTYSADEYQKAFASRPFNERIKIALSRVSTLYSENEMFNYAVEATLSEATIMTTQSDDNEEEAIIRPVGGRRSSIVENLVSVHGLEAMISAFLGGIGEYSREDIEKLFKQCDTDDSGYINRVEFAYLVFSMRFGTNTDLITSKCKWESKPKSRAFSLHKRRLTADSLERIRMIGNESTVRYMKNMVNDIERPLHDWSMYYCGNATPIVKSLHDIEKKCHIGLRIEKFDW